MPAAGELHVLSPPGMDDAGDFPDVIILGVGKCGTNALAVALQRLADYQEPARVSSYAEAEETRRLGYTGEINWPCGRWSGDDLAQYKRHFPARAESLVPSARVGSGSRAIRWLDKSTSLAECARNVSRAVPSSVRLFGLICDPLQAVWSRMNHERMVRRHPNSNPASLVRPSASSATEAPVRSATRPLATARARRRRCWKRQRGGSTRASAVALW